MEQCTDTSIASRTRSQKYMAQHSPSHITPSTALQEKNEDLSQMSFDTNTTLTQHQENNMEQLTTSTHLLSFIPSIEQKHQPLNSIGKEHEEYSTTEEDEMEKEKRNSLSYANIQLQHLQETFAAQLVQTQKVIEEQRQLLFQQQLNIQELRDGKRKEQHHGLSVQFSNNVNNPHDHPNFSSSSQVKAPSAHKPLANNSFKYDNFIEQQLLKDKINNIRKFSGNKFDDVDEWLQNIEHDFSSTLISDEIKLKLIPKSLTHDAENWFEQNKHRLLTWTTFKIEIQHRFQSSLHKDQKFIRLRERKQQSKETGQQFIDAMEKLCFQVNSSMMEQEKMLHIKAGLKPSLKEKVFDKQPQSMDQLRNTVKRIEDIEAMLNNGNNNEDRFEQTSFSSNFSQPSQHDNNCYALPSHNNNPHHYRRQNNYHYQQYQQEETDQQMYRPNQNYQSRNTYEQHWNRHQPNYRTSTSSYPTTANNNSKKY
jgi:hypothetical protein